MQLLPLGVAIVLTPTISTLHKGTDAIIAKIRAGKSPEDDFKKLHSETTQQIKNTIPKV